MSPLDHKPHHALSDRLGKQEQCVLRLATEGLTSNDIAQKMNISSHTVEEYWERIRRKLHARNKVHAIAIAIQIGLIHWGSEHQE